jgi:hypothetical protein
MGLFDILKNVFSNSSNTKKTNYVQPTKSNYIPTYHIEDWQPKLKYPEYDKLFSLQKYLESIDLPKTTISKVMKSSNPFGEAKNLLNGLNEKVEWSDMCWKETQRMERWIKVLSLWEALPERIIESTFMYLLLRLGWLCQWDASKQKAINDTGLFYLLEACKQNDYTRLLRAVDADIISCFALAHIRSGKNLTQIVSEGFNYLEMNTKHNGSAHGSFYNLFGKQQIKGLIGKIIESAYIKNKFSSKRLFFKEDDVVSVNPKDLKYDISKMKAVRGFYLPNIEDVENIKKDVMHLNTFLLKAKMLITSFPTVQINAEDLVFRFGKVLKDESTEFCVFTYAPNTPTGKASKYPLKLGFWCARTSKERQVKQGRGFLIIPPNGIHGDIEFLANGEIGKARVIIAIDGSFYIVNILDKKGEKIITKIEGNNKKGERIELYNANRKD